jgi:hypothetical protein
MENPARECSTCYTTRQEKAKADVPDFVNSFLPASVGNGAKIKGRPETTFP